MNIEQVLSALDPDIYQKFRQAIELGKWPDGRPLTDEQKTLCIQAVIAWEHEHLPQEERTGYIAPRAGACSHDAEQTAEQPLQWQTDKTDTQ